MNRIDFDLHGLVGIRLINPTPEAEAGMMEQFGPLRASLHRQPDITLHFVKRMSTAGLRFLGGNRYAFSNDGFYFLSGSGNPARVRIPFQRFGSLCDLTCEKGWNEFHLLNDLVKVLAIKKDCAALHGSAFTYQGRSFLLSSWAKGGKTSALLGFLSLGAQFVADDCVLLSGDGKSMYGLPTPLEISARHLEVLPSLRAILGLSCRSRIAGLALLRKSESPLMHLAPPSSFAARAWRRTLAALERRCVHRLSPQRAFGNGLTFQAPSPKDIFILISHDRPGVEVEPASRSQAVERLAASAFQELSSVNRHYLAYKYAFPGRINSLLEGAEARQREILSRALMGKRAYFVRHPYPVCFRDLYAALRPYCESRPFEAHATPAQPQGQEKASPALRPVS